MPCAIRNGGAPARTWLIGLAARADVTLFDEPYAGLDAVARQIFYDRLLAEYAERPRTILLSTHLIDEAAGLLERVIVIDHGRVVLTAGADDLRGVATAVSTTRPWSITITRSSSPAASSIRWVESRIVRGCSAYSASSRS